MKVKLSLLGAVAIAMTLALTGLLNGTTPAKALMPDPVQPFGPDEVGGIDTTALGQDVLNYTVTNIIRGERVGLPWIYTGGGWEMQDDAAVVDGTIVGDVVSEIDALCDSTSTVDTDILADSTGDVPPAMVNYQWQEATTDVATSGETYLLAMMPPYDWLFRHKAPLTWLWLFGTVRYPTVNVLNTVYTDVPFSPSGTFTATTKLGGNPVFPSGAGAVCLDSPQSSESLTGTETTSVYSTPPLAGDSDVDGVDDASGLYPRWTAFENRSSTGHGDSRKPFKSPPSIRSDSEYIERIVDLQCFWLDEDGCTTCDDDVPADWISPEESLNDPDKPANIDADGDCLANAADAQPGQPTDTDDSLNGTLCPVLPYSEAPNLVQHDTAADQDCDGLVDGVEVAWGSSPTLADTDSDGASDFIEMFQFTNPTVADTDGDGLLDKPDDDYIAAAAGVAEAGEAVNEDDNCPSVANATQLNSDAIRRANGAQIPGTWASNPIQDKWGDACDQDDDNDWAVDVAELARTPTATDPLVKDSDGDRCLDGVEGYLDTDPMSAASKCPANLSADRLRFFKACRWNEAPDGTNGTNWDAEYDGVEDGVEWNSDGDDKNCQDIAKNIFDPDNDNGTGTGVAAPDEIIDNIEIKGYGTFPANKDSDGDGCDDWKEIIDLNGNRQAEVTDVMFIAKRAFGLLPASDSDSLMDIDKNGSVQTSDALMAAKNSVLVKPHAACASEG